MYDNMHLGFDWDGANTEHVALHQVRPEEAEQAIDDPHALSFERARARARRGSGSWARRSMAAC